jgi:hypothetical protein
MAEIPSSGDQYQQKIRRRNTELAHLLNGTWKDENITKIWRDPEPSNPPDPDGPTNGKWMCETVD